MHAAVHLHSVDEGGGLGDVLLLDVLESDDVLGWAQDENSVEELDEKAGDDDIEMTSRPNGNFPTSAIRKLQ